MKLHNERKEKWSGGSFINNIRNLRRKQAKRMISCICAISLLTGWYSTAFAVSRAKPFEMDAAQLPELIAYGGNRAAVQEDPLRSVNTVFAVNSTSADNTEPMSSAEAASSLTMSDGFSEDALGKIEVTAMPADAAESLSIASANDGLLIAASLPSGATVSFTDSQGHTMQGIYVGGTLQVRGNGIIENSPFYRYADSIQRIELIGNFTIGVAAFYGLDRLTSISIPEGTAYIGEGAFWGCTSLTSVLIPSSASRIDRIAFWNCTSLQSASIPSVTRIEEGAFYNCSSLQSVTLPENAGYVGNLAFAYCHSLTGIKADGIQELGNGAFLDCISLKEFDMPDTLTKTGTDIFNGCTALSSVNISTGLSAVESFSFWGCTGLQSIDIPDNITSIGKAAFYNCEELKTVKFPSGYTDVGAYAFSFCNNAEPVNDVIRLKNVGAEAFYGVSIAKNIELYGGNTEIGTAAFHSNKMLNSINFNNSVVSVGDHAFYDCYALETITNAPTYKEVGKLAFYQCKAVREVRLSSDCETLGYGCFAACPELKSIDFAGAPAEIGAGAFYQCTSLTKAVISENCGAIGDGAFCGCTALSEVDFSGAEASVGTSAFNSCQKLDTVGNEGAIKSLGDYAFYNTAIADASGFKNINSLGEGAFAYCTKLKNASVPEGMTEIPKNLFVGCIGLESVDIPAAVKVIKEAAFGECDSLVSITVPDGVTVIEDSAFAQCDNLKELKGGKNVSEIGDRVFSFCGGLEKTGFTGKLEKIGYAAFYDCKKLTDIGDISNLSRIEDHCFANCNELRNLTLNNNVEYIGDWAFFGCRGIESVNIPGNIEKLGRYAFENCTMLETVRLGNGISVLEEEVFAGCSELKSISIPSSVTEIKDRVFWGCEALVSAEISANARSLGEGVFYNCKALREIEIPNSVRSIDRSCFYGCSQLRSASLSENLEDVSRGMFYNCAELSSIFIPDTVRSIGEAAFYGCEKLESVALNAAVTSIGEYAFMECGALVDITIPFTVRAIGTGAFANCKSLTEIKVPRQVAEVNNYTFYGCSGLKDASLQGNIIAVGVGAFYDCAALESVSFSGGAPAIIGDKAFYNTGSGLTFFSNSVDPGWTTPTWTGPDGNTYNTVMKEADITGECGDDVFWEYYTESGILVIKGSGRMDDYASEGGQPWYTYSDEITSVHINDGITYIGDRAFSGCPMLRSVYIADSVEECGEYSFAKCENLVYIELPYNLDKAGNYMLYGCKALKEVSLPAGLREIGSYCFFGCGSIETISIPDSTEKLGEGAFYNCSGLVRVALPAGIREIPDHAFNGCSALGSAVISDGTKAVGKYAFNNCKALEWVYIAGDGVGIGEGAFANTKNLKGICFMHSEPDTIGYRALYNSGKDLAVYYSDSAKWSSEALRSADGTEISCASRPADDKGGCGDAAGWSFYAAEGVLDIYGSGAMDDFSDGDAPWQEHADEIRYIIVSDGITSVGANAFSHERYVEKVIISDNVISIGAGAFADCDKLRSISLPQKLKTLGANAFYHCSSLVYISVPGGIEEIPEYAFALCKSLRGAELGNGVRSVGYSAFYGCDKLKSIILPDTVSGIGAWSFARCAKLKSADIGGISDLGEYAFFGCESLAGLNISERLKAIPAYAFSGAAITEITIPGNVEAIGERAFWYCSELKDVSLGSVSEIGDGAFYETAIEAVDIPKDTVEIGAYAFAGCSDLESISVDPANTGYSSNDGVLLDKDEKTVIQYPIGKAEKEYAVNDGVESIGEGAFYNGALSSIKLPESIGNVSDAAFAFCQQLDSLEIASDGAEIKDGAFYGCGSLSSVHFRGSAPESIGEDAFSETSDGLLFIYEDGSDGWTEKRWTGPDGNIYNTAVNTQPPETGTPDHATISVVNTDYDEDKQILRYSIELKNNTPSGSEAAFYVAVYEGEELTGIRLGEFEFAANSSYNTDITATGGAREGKTVFRLFLWDRDSMVPLADPVLITCGQSFGDDAATIAELGAICQPEPDVEVDTSSEKEEFTTASELENTAREISVNMEFGSGDLEEIISESAGNAVAGFDMTVSAVCGDRYTEKHYTTNIDMTGFDSRNGYVPCGIDIPEQGYSEQISDRRKAWMPLSYPDYRLSSEGKLLADTDAAEVSGLTADASGAHTNGVAFLSGSSSLFSVRGMGFSGTGEKTVRRLSSGEYVFTVPYSGVNLLYTLNASELTAAVSAFAAAEGLSDPEKELSIYNVSMTGMDENGQSKTLCKLMIETAGNEVIKVELTELASFEGDAEDRTYESAPVAEETEASEKMNVAVNSVTPGKASNGRVTVRFDGLLFEAGDEPYISDGNEVYKAVDVYYYSHNKLYATFDLVNAPDGEYEIGVIRRDARIAAETAFTVDSSLPKGTLSASLNVDKTAKEGVENNGSVTFTNTGYTDVYAPVLLIDCGNVEISDTDGDEYKSQTSVFAYNAEGLPGVVANGETAAYNFKYKVSGSNGFVMKIYNYADITENLTDEIELTDGSETGDILSYNMNKLTGIRACDFAESIARMASVQGSLGETCFGMEYLRSIYLSSASGTLAGDTIASSTDLSSIQLGISRYYYADLTLRQTDGLWGRGWYSGYDITAEYNELENGDDNIIVRAGSGVTVYKQKDGVYTDAIYGLSTAERTAGGITVSSNDGSAMAFNTDGKLIRSTDVYGNYIELIYNDGGKLTEVRSSDGDCLSLAYNDGRVSDITSAVTGDTVHYEYENDMLTAVINTFGAVVYEYDTVNQDGRKNALIKASYSTGAHTAFEYDELGRVTAVADTEGRITYEYTGENTVKVTDQVGNESLMYFNASGRLKRTVDPDGVMTESEYSPLLLNTGMRVGLFNGASYEYDDKYNLTKATASDGSSVNYSYDGKGNVTSVSDRGGISTVYDRNAQGSLERLLYADGKYESFEYDSKGNITAAIKRDGSRTEYLYDEYSRVTEVRYSGGEFIGYEYNDRGKLVMINENGSKTRLSYDPAGELISISYPDNKSLEYTYDENGNMTGIKVTYGGVNINYTYAYDSLGRLTSVSDAVFYEYNADGSLKRQTNYTGTYTDYAYESGRLSRITNCKADGSVISFFEYSYDEMGNISSVTKNDGTWSYGYDKLGQLISATDPAGDTTLYNYDMSGNRTSVITKDGTVNYNSNELNQYTSYGSAVRSYDLNGNLISETSEKGTTLYEYDYMDRLVKVTEPDGKTTEYRYDIFGNRDGVSVNGELMEYINTPGGAGYALASFKNDYLRSVYIQGIGLVGRTDYEENGDGKYYTYSYDHLGSTQEIVDQRGNVVNSYTYDQEGAVISSTEEIENPFTYVGMYGIMDDGNGLYYDRARYISADTMSFISPDPIRQNSDLNVYRYVYSNYISNIDITGQRIVCTGKKPFECLTYEYYPDKTGIDFSFEMPKIKFPDIGQYMIEGTKEISRLWKEFTEPSFEQKVNFLKNDPYWSKPLNAAARYGCVDYLEGKGWSYHDSRHVTDGWHHLSYEEFVVGVYGWVKHKKSIDDTITGYAANISLDIVDSVLTDATFINYMPNIDYSVYSANNNCIIVNSMPMVSGLAMTAANLNLYKQLYGVDYNDGFNYWTLTDRNTVLLTPMTSPAGFPTINAGGGIIDAFIAGGRVIGGFVGGFIP